MEAALIRKHPVISKSCGGIISISSGQKGFLVDEFRSFERCAWIVKSEMKKVKVQYANESSHESSGVVIGKLVDGDEEIQCSKMYADDELIVATPFVLQFTAPLSSLHNSSWGTVRFMLELTPIDDEGSQESQPATYHINRLNKGSLNLAVTPLRLESLLGLVAVFQTRRPNWRGRVIVCTPTGADCCDDYAAAYTMDLFSSGGSCKKMSKLNEGKGKQSTDESVIVLYWSHKIGNESQCGLTWSETPAPVAKHWEDRSAGERSRASKGGAAGAMAPRFQDDLIRILPLFVILLRF